jgi:hypothetical protein
MNVGMTRARRKLLLVGDSSTLSIYPARIRPNTLKRSVRYYIFSIYCIEFKYE